MRELTETTHPSYVCIRSAPHDLSKPSYSLGNHSFVASLSPQCQRSVPCRLIGYYSATTPQKAAQNTKRVESPLSPGSPFPYPLPRFLLYPGGGALPFTSALAGLTPTTPEDATPSTAAVAAAAPARNSPRPVAVPSLSWIRSAGQLRDKRGSCWYKKRPAASDQPTNRSGFNKDRL